jgi:class 3 adenylate cyclase
VLISLAKSYHTERTNRTIFITALKLRERRIRAAMARDRVFKLLEKAPLPPAIITSLRRGVVPKRDEIGTYLFADIVGFTAFSSGVSAKMLVKILNALFVACDERAAICGVTKVKTIGDCYVAAAGILGDTSSGEGGHAGKICKFGLHLHDVMHDLNEEHGVEPRLSWRIGVHTGPCIGGVIGSKKFVYDLWGSAVTRANKMEEYGKPGMVHVSDESYQRCFRQFHWEKTRLVDVMGDGNTVRTHMCLREKTKAEKLRK